MEIIDIRDKYSFRISHFPTARNIDLYQLIIEPGEYLDKNKEYLIVCEYGLKSKKASEILNKLGYHTISLENGYKKHNESN